MPPPCEGLPPRCRALSSLSCSPCWVLGQMLAACVPSRPAASQLCCWGHGSVSPLHRGRVAAGPPRMLVQACRRALRKGCHYPAILSLLICLLLSQFFQNYQAQAWEAFVKGADPKGGACWGVPSRAALGGGECWGLRALLTLPQPLSHCLNAAGEKGAGQSRHVLRLNFPDANAIWKHKFNKSMHPPLRLDTWLYPPACTDLAHLSSCNGGFTPRDPARLGRGGVLCGGGKGPRGALVTPSTGYQASHFLASTQAMPTAAPCRGRCNFTPRMEKLRLRVQGGWASCPATW